MLVEYRPIAFADHVPIFEQWSISDKAGRVLFKRKAVLRTVGQKSIIQKFSPVAFSVQSIPSSI
jgi:hypothetical protein